MPDLVSNTRGLRTQRTTMIEPISSIERTAKARRVDRGAVREERELDYLLQRESRISEYEAERG